MGKNNRGASYPSISLSEAVAKLRIAFEKVGKGPSSKEEYVVGLGYSGISGTSSRAFAALIHFGLLSKTGTKYEFTELAMNILFPKDSSEPNLIDLTNAALSPKLFSQLYERYNGQPLPTMLSNTLVIDYQIHDKSAQEAATNFRQSLDYAGLLEGGIVGEASFSTEDDNITSDDIDESAADIFSDSKIINPDKRQQSRNEDSLNRIEIVLREGVKAGIFAPYNLTIDEKQKLKTIIDLL